MARKTNDYECNRNSTLKMNICKFALLVFALELCAGIECAYKHNWKMAGVWTLYSMSNLLLAFVNE